MKKFIITVTEGDEVCSFDHTIPIEAESIEALFCALDDAGQKVADERNAEVRGRNHSRIKVCGVYLDRKWLVYEEAIRHSKRNNTYKWVKSVPSFESLDDWFKHHGELYTEKET